MVLFILRAIFLLAFAAVGMSFAKAATGPGLFSADLVVPGCIGLALMVIALDIFVPQKSLAAMSGLFFGLMVGMVVAYGLSLIVDLAMESLMPGREDSAVARFVGALKLGLGVICCYLAVSFVLQTKDDVRFVIPYVEFSKQTKGARPLLLDTSVIIDGRIADIAETRIIDNEIVVPRFVLQELQAVADSQDKLKRGRGRRGLDMLNKMRLSEKTTIKVLDVEVSRDDAQRGVDEMLLETAKLLGGRVVTNDYNLNKLAQIRGVEVININDLANALKPVVLPGEAMTVKIVKPGEELGQGVAYLEDGTMVVAEGARDKIGSTINITVTSVLQTSAGRMIFGRSEGAPVVERRRPRPARPGPSEQFSPS